MVKLDGKMSSVLQGASSQLCYRPSLDSLVGPFKFYLMACNEERAPKGKRLGRREEGDDAWLGRPRGKNVGGGLDSDW